MDSNKQNNSYFMNKGNVFQTFARRTPGPAGGKICDTLSDIGHLWFFYHLPSGKIFILFSMSLSKKRQSSFIVHNGYCTSFSVWYVLILMSVISEMKLWEMGSAASAACSPCCHCFKGLHFEWKLQCLLFPENWSYCLFLNSNLSM